MFLVEYFLLFAYFLVIKFSITLESIIVLLFFPLMLIPICNYTILIDAASLLAETVPHYFFWLLLSEESNNFPASPRDTSAIHNVSYLDGILRIFCVRSGFRNYPLYRIVTVFVCSSWLIFLIILVSADDLS